MPLPYEDYIHILDHSPLGFLCSVLYAFVSTYLVFIVTKNTIFTFLRLQCDVICRWPIKVFRPCPSYLQAGYQYKREGQTMDQVLFSEPSTKQKVRHVAVVMI